MTAATGGSDPVDPGGAVSPTLGVPSDNTTLVEVLDALRRGGYRSSLASTDAGMLVCSNCGKRTAPERFRAQQERRLEGASDPADEMLVVAGTCEHCGERGILVLGFGPAASPADAAVLSRLKLESI